MNMMLKRIHCVSLALYLKFSKPSFFSSHNEPNELLIWLFAVSFTETDVVFTMYLNLEDFADNSLKISAMRSFMLPQAE